MSITDAEILERVTELTYSEHDLILDCMEGHPDSLRILTAQLQNGE